MSKPREIKWKILENGCWQCISHKNKDNYYPLCRRDGKVQKIYKFVYCQKNGQVKPNTVIRHTCDNKLCINPSHLIPGTHADNVRDMIERKRKAVGENCGLAKLKNNQVKEIFLDKLSPTLLLSKKFNVCNKTITNIRNRRSWKVVTNFL